MTAQSLWKDGMGKGGTISSSITAGWSQTTEEMETGRLRAAAAFSGRNICEILGGSSRGGGAGTGSERSQGCARTDNCPTGWLPRLLQQHFPPPSGMRQRPSCATSNPSVSVASCFSILFLVTLGWPSWPEWEQFFLTANRLLCFYIGTFILLALQSQSRN